MEQPDKQRTSRGELVALWLGALFPAFVLAAQFQINLVLVRQACAAQHRIALFVVTTIAIVLTLGASAIAVAIWKRHGRRWPNEAADENTRTRFLAVWALLGNGIFLLLIIAQGIATIFFDPCQR